MIIWPVSCENHNPPQELQSTAGIIIHHRNHNPLQGSQSTAGIIIYCRNHNPPQESQFTAGITKSMEIIIPWAGICHRNCNVPCRQCWVNHNSDTLTGAPSLSIFPSLSSMNKVCSRFLTITQQDTQLPNTCPSEVQFALMFEVIQPEEA